MEKNSIARLNQGLDTQTARITFQPMAHAAAEPLAFSDAGRIPEPGDNVAIAVRTLPAGTRVLIRQLVFEFSHTVLEGHRFAIFRIRKGEPLLSWGLPFGLALRDIEPGEYVCNEKILRVLKERNVDLELPPTANFLDHRLPFTLDTASFRSGKQVASTAPTLNFEGFRRTERKGVGTRNYVVVLGTNSRTAAFARAVSRRFAEVRAQYPNIDGVVPVDHTEGGSATEPNNLQLTLRTLAGFMVNPNVGAVLCVDYGAELLSNAALRTYLADHEYPTEGLIHDYLSITGSFEAAVEKAGRTVLSWLPKVNAYARESVPISQLRLGLQCGGSDAFSGVSANPLVGLLSRDTVAQGGSANLAETDELIGAESHVLANVRDLPTAQSFLAKLERFQHWAARHGHSAEGNPSGGNMYRGLYNIAIKSIGAARKKHPATRLDYVVDFGELMTEPGFYFMDSPGNDLESIAGQVAAGCNMILFATGNGSITNFPFVPTIKIMTTTGRFELVSNEMDFNAGRYQDGESLEDLGREALGKMLRIASGQPSAGERAGHSQVQLWREWRNNQDRPRANGDAPPSSVATPAQVEFARVICAAGQPTRCALVLPTSLCSGQIALQIAEKLNRTPGLPFDRAVALPHTEGCGNSGGESESLFMRTMAGYLAHSFVTRALLLEHGCEKTHNDAFRKVLRELHLPDSEYGFRSVQLDGGIDRVTEKSLAWFQQSNNPSIKPATFSLALHGRDLPANVRDAFAFVQSAFEQAGATVVSTSGAGLKLAYGQRFDRPGVYRMDCPTEDDIEIITGLGATGVQMILVYEAKLLLPANPLVPTIQATAGSQSDADLVIENTETADQIAEKFLTFMLAVRRRKQTLAANRVGNIAFQITRGYEGISL